MGEQITSVLSSGDPVSKQQTIDAMGFRTRFIDNALAERNDAIKQVVLLAAGLDARAYRLDCLNHAAVFEIDRCKGLMDHKKKILQNDPLVAKSLVSIQADLILDDWETLLLAKGFDRSIPTFWIMEGLVMYLSREQNEQLLRQIDSLSAPQSVYWVDMTCSVPTKRSDWRFAPLLSYGEDDFANGVLQTIPWKVHIQADFSQPTTYYGRSWTPINIQMKGDDEQAQATPLRYGFLMGSK